MPLEVLVDAVASIAAEVRREVVVVEQAARHHLLVSQHLRMVYSHLGRFLVVPAPWCRRRQRLALVEVVLGVHLALASGCRPPLQHLRREETLP